MSDKQKPPRLVDLIITWMKKELPKAGYEEGGISKPPNSMVGRKTFTIWKGKGKNKRECFKVEFVTGDYAFGTIFSTHTKSNLFEEFTIKDDRVIFGKWNNGIEVLAADQDFFEKMALYMTRAAMVVTMGDFVPNIPEASDVEI